MNEAAICHEDIIKVISFNLRRDFGPFKKHRWEKRKNAATSVIKDSGASIIGVQELLPNMRADIKALLESYSVFGWGRFYGKKNNDDEHTDIILKNDDVEMSSCKTFWLSKKPEQFASRAYYAMFPRICTVAEVVLKNTGKRIRVFNTHFDHICGLARVLGVRIILDYMNQLNQQSPLPTILMGDFNAKPDSKPIRMLRENLLETPYIRLNDVYTKANIPLFNTHHGFKGKIKTKKHPIDYIFVSDDFDVTDVQIFTKEQDGVYPSDHYPIIATLALK